MHLPTSKATGWWHVSRTDKKIGQGVYLEGRELRKRPHGEAAHLCKFMVTCNALKHPTISQHILVREINNSIHLRRRVTYQWQRLQFEIG
jgi:hypothetical protein